MITLKDISLRRGKNILLDDVNWTIARDERIGIIGANGTGKTSLFSLLLNELESDTGEVIIARQIKFAHVAQETKALPQTALDFVIDGDDELRVLQEELVKAEQEHDGHKIAELHEQISMIDGYSAKARAAQLLVGLSFTHQELTKPVSDFSGGFRVRLNLARALMCRADILLLDEPTNHLDLDAVIWLEDWLNHYTGTLLLISHDRDFLDHTITQIAHLYNQKLKIYTGNYSQFETERANQLQLQQAQYEKQQKHIAHMQAFVDRFRYKATKARQAQSRLKAIERLELVAKVQTESPFSFEFKAPKENPYPLLYLEDAEIAYGERTILNHLNLSISPAERITILGPNGAGKSSLMKLLAGELLPKAGERFASSGLKIGYFAQHQVDSLHLHESALAHLRNLAEEASEQVLRDFLGGFDFRGDKVFEPVGNFSGGEKSRLALALIVWQRPNLLLLDEPTNHLDLEMRHAMNIALQEYQGALILVTHDRFLIRSTTDKFLLVASGKLQEFKGDLADYQRWLFDYRKRQLTQDIEKDIQDNETARTSTTTGISKKAQRQMKAKLREARKPLLNKIEQLECDMEILHQELDTIAIELSNQAIYEAENKDSLSKLLIEEARIKKELAQIEEEWLHACQQRDKGSNDLSS